MLAPLRLHRGPDSARRYAEDRCEIVHPGHSTLERSTRPQRLAFSRTLQLNVGVHSIILENSVLFLQVKHRPCGNSNHKGKLGSVIWVAHAQTAIIGDGIHMIAPALSTSHWIEKTAIIRAHAVLIVVFDIPDTASQSAAHSYHLDFIKGAETGNVRNQSYSNLISSQIH